MSQDEALEYESQSQWGVAQELKVIGLDGSSGFWVDMRSGTTRVHKDVCAAAKWEMEMEALFSAAGG